MPSVGFEATIPAFERAKTVHALDGAATMLDSFRFIQLNNISGRTQIMKMMNKYSEQTSASMFRVRRQKFPPMFVFNISKRTDVFICTLKIEVAGSSETLVTIYHTILRHFQADSNRPTQRRENLKPHE
jgi:hypothetical protein